MNWTVSIITSLIMIVIGVFWMFVWLVAANGYSETIGTAILGANLFLVILSTIAAAYASGRLSKRFTAKTGKSILIVAPLCIVVTITVAVAVLFAGSLIIIAMAETARRSSAA